jgi:2-polyprenyl-3-methyl-5-hydroxy-6-metoxy-1,4-benzoquinol methylase
MTSYDPGSYFRDRFSEYGADDLRGPGDASKSHRQNLREYRRAWRRLRRTVRDRYGRAVLEGASVLEIGVGNGYYTDRLVRAGADRVVGMDVTDVLFPEVARLVPAAELIQGDITETSPPGGPYRLILMIDVTQHIVDDAALRVGLCRHLAPALAPGGVFAFTTWDSATARSSHYERSRPLLFYRSLPCFEGWQWEEKVRFRDKWLVTVQRPG